MHLSSIFSTKQNLTIDIKSCLTNERSEVFREHSRTLFKQLARYELKIADLEREVSDERLEAGVDKLEQNGGLYLIAYHYDQPVGLLVSRKNKQGEIMALHVNDHYRTQGIGKLLVNQLRRITREESIEVTSLTMNLVAMAFYRKLGFTFDEGSHIARGTLVVR